MGDYKVFWVTIGIVFLSNELAALSSKLDFGDDSKASVVSNTQRSTQLKFETKKKDDLDKIGVVCTTGCDTKNQNGGSATLETDVVVSVKSILNNGNTTKKVEDVPDIPIVLGTKGAGAKNEFPAVHRGLQFHPVSRSFQQNGAHLTPVNIQTAFPNLMSLVPGNLNEVQNQNGIEFSPRTYPTEVVSLPDGYKYRTEGLEIKVPYFEPTYHKHYYGENSPPQFAYYPAKKAFRNPVAFNNVARPAFAFTSRSLPSQNRRHDETCDCHNRGSSASTWYPSASNQVQRLIQGRSDDLQVAIDDKIAPIN